jgi:hypothetical protein
MEGTILLVSGRVDHKGEEVSLLADMAIDWETAAARGQEAFGRDVAALDRGRQRRPAGAPQSDGNGSSRRGREPIAVGPGRPAETAPIAPVRPLVSPLRTDAADRATSASEAAVATLPAIAPGEPIPSYPESSLAEAGPDRDDEPPFPEETRRRAMAEAAAATSPGEAGPAGVLHVRFATDAGTERLVPAMEEVRTVLRGRPGATRVVIHLPQGAGHAPLPMELRSGVAYDAELLAEVRRRLGDGLVDLALE